jgi:hypothetical protein
MVQLLGIMILLDLYALGFGYLGLENELVIIEL